MLRARMIATGVTLSDLAPAVGVSQAQLSRMLHGRRRIDLEQLQMLCSYLQVDLVDVVREARGEAVTISSSDASASNLDVKELARRTVCLANSYDGDPFSAAQTAAARVGVSLTRPQWLDVLSGDLVSVPDRALLSAVSVALGGGTDYLITADEERVAQVEAGFELRDAIRETGTSVLAARALSSLGADQLKAVAALVRRA